MKNLKKLIAIILLMSGLHIHAHRDQIFTLKKNIISGFSEVDYKYFIKYVYTPLKRKFNNKIPYSAMIQALNKSVAVAQKQHNELSDWHWMKRMGLDQRISNFKRLAQSLK